MSSFDLVLTLIVLNVLSTKPALKSRGAEKLMEGRPKVLIKGGGIDDRTLQEESMPMQELHFALRQDEFREAL